MGLVISSIRPKISSMNNCFSILLIAQSEQSEQSLDESHYHVGIIARSETFTV
jgi:hypothetical protein